MLLAKRSQRPCDCIYTGRLSLEVHWFNIKAPDVLVFHALALSQSDFQYGIQWHV